jgi:hypothetical protein
MKTNALLVIVGLLGLIGIPLWLYTAFVQPYLVFVAAEKQSLPLYADLNNAALMQLPPPPTALELRRLSKNTTAFGADNLYSHGVVFVVDYKVIAAVMNAQDVLAYYDKTVRANGWDTYDGNASGVGRFYIHDTACLTLTFGSFSEQTIHYTLTLWHDYAHQSFSPTLPPLWLMNFYEQGETQILGCPP